MWLQQVVGSIYLITLSGMLNINLAGTFLQATCTTD